MNSTFYSIYLLTLACVFINCETSGNNIKGLTDDIESPLYDIS